MTKARFTGKKMLKVMRRLEAQAEARRALGRVCLTKPVVKRDHALKGKVRKTILTAVERGSGLEFNVRNSGGSSTEATWARDTLLE